MMLGRAALALILVAAMCAAMPAAAQESVTATSTLEPRTATVGDRLTLTIEVEHPEGVTVEGPGFGADFGGLELIDIADARAEPERTTLTYTLTAFRTGSIVVPALPVTYRGPSGESGAVAAPSQRVSIESVLGAGEGELRPLKPQLDIADEAPTPLLPATIVAGFAVLTAFGYVLISRAIAQRPAVPAAAPVAAVPPDVYARAALDAIAADGMGEADPREYYGRIAAVVRGYLSERFAFPAYAMTRRELEREMSAAGIDRWPARVTANLLEGCDAAQFAGFRPPPERADADLTAAYEIVELTRGE
ncbi:MAG: hypothetical protein WEC75_03055 [Dehalococcoidia bacterium]